MATPRILIVGAGATGSYVGACLAQAGHDVTFLAREARAAQLRTRGLRILHQQTEAIDAVVRTPDDLDPTYDLALITVKAPGLTWAIEHTRRALTHTGTALPLLNGMAQLDALEAAFGPGRVVAGSIRIVAHLNADGDVVWNPPLATVTVGELAGGLSDRTTALGRTLNVPGIDVVVSPDIADELWRKWYFIVAAGVIGTLGGGTIGDIMANDGGAHLIEAVLAETMAVAAAAGHPMDDGELARARSFLAVPGSRFISSLYRDVAAGRPGEREHLVGDFTARARALGVPTPLCDLALLRMRVTTRP